ncbi:MAG: 4Fe-4S dicluster domain-containing protein [Thermodesulfobacteriota bacterium]
MAEPLAFAFDPARCSGCLACVVACLDQNDLPAADLSFRRVTRIERGQGPGAVLAFVSLACHHCGDAPCLKACPAGALSKREEDGVVVVDPDRCLGCRCCLLTCPFGAPRFPDGIKMAKCDFCRSRLEAGREPACVRVCPTGALTFGPLTELSRRKVEQRSRILLDSLPDPLS